MDIRFSYTLVGTFVIFMTCLLFLMIIWLSSPKEKNVTFYKIIFHESVSGLEEKSSVLFNGVNVGYVSNVYLDNDDLSVVNVIVAIGNKIKVGPRTIATLKTQGVTGITQINLSLNVKTKVLALVTDKDGRKIIPAMPSLFFRLDSAVQATLTEINKMATNFSKLLDSNNVKEFSDIIANIAIMTNTLANKSQEIGEIINNSNQFTSRLDSASQDFPLALKNWNNVTIKAADLFSTLDKQTSKELNSVLSTVDNTVQDWNIYLLPKLNQAINELQQILLNLQTVSGDLVDNPSILVRGKEQAPLGPGER